VAVEIGDLDNIPREFVDEENHLKLVNGHCIFFDPRTRHCKIYEDRPSACRTFEMGSYFCSSAIAVTREEGWFDPAKYPRTIPLTVLGTPL